MANAPVPPAPGYRPMVVPEQAGHVIGNEQFQNIIRQNRRGMPGAGGPIDYAGNSLEAVRGQTAAQNLMTQILLNLTGRNQGTQYRANPTAQQTSGLQMQPQYGNFAGGLNDRQPINPLPFNEYFQKTANFMGIVGSLDPDLYNRNEQVLDMMKQMGPEAVQSLKTQDLSLYLGVPQDFFVNRLNIALQRTRESDVYAFK